LREWIIILACVGADGEALPPGIIYQAANGNIRSSWVEDITTEHSIFVTSSPSGWTNNDVGLAWLEQVFDRSTKRKAGRSYQLLILDGHGSHITMDFIKYCNNHRILLCILAPHSTHTLQPLDVVLFKPLSSSYSKGLFNDLHKTQGLVSVKKGDFFPLFWQAWISSFKKTSILKSFKATGIWPMDPEVILKRFHHSRSDSQEEEASSGSLSDTDWRKVRKILDQSVKKDAQKEAKKISLSFHYLQVQKELVDLENKGLREALQVKQKHKNKGKTFDLQQRQEYYGGAVFWSPRKVREACAREAVKEQEYHDLQLQKV
jgi:hypothetical protein